MLLSRSLQLDVHDAHDMPELDESMSSADLTSDSRLFLEGMLRAGLVLQRPGGRGQLQ